MKAISIRQPWAWAILCAGKRVENRDWKPSSPSLHMARRLLGQTIALHASKGCTRDEYDDATDFMAEIGALRVGEARSADLSKPIPPRWDGIVRGAIVGTARLVDIHARSMSYHQIGEGTGAVCAACGWKRPTPMELAARAAPPMPLCSKPDPWRDGSQLGFLLADVAPLPRPIPFTGDLGFFEVPDALIAGAP